MAVELPPGDHDVRFVFTFPRIYASMSVSVIAWIGAGMGVVFSGRIGGAGPEHDLHVKSRLRRYAARLIWMLAVRPWIKRPWRVWRAYWGLMC